MKTESIRIDSKLVEKIRKHVRSTRQTISGFINVAVEKHLQEEKKEKRTMDEVAKLNEDNYRSQRRY